MSAIRLPSKLMDVTPSMSEKNTKHNKSCLQDEACVRIKTESPKANYDTSMHMFERSQKSSDSLRSTTPHPTPLPSPLRRTVFNRRLVSGHVMT